MLTSPVSPDRSNNFNILRLILASMVVLEHFFVCSLDPSLCWVTVFGIPGTPVSLGTTAVQGFFVISGYLVVASYERSRSIGSYFEKRARRILPGYWAALLFVLCIGVLFSSLPAPAFLTSRETWKYVAANLTFANFMQLTLPGLFTHNLVNKTVNGPLWTIKIELMFYAVVPIIVFFCRRLGRWQTLAAIFVASILYRAACRAAHHEGLAEQLPGQLSFFVAGAFAYYYHDRLTARPRLTWLAALVACLAYAAIGGFALCSVCVPLVIVCFALLFPQFEGPAKYGDFSYGTYVLHYPVIQTAVALGAFQSHPVVAICLVACIIAVLAVLSWNIIEKPCLLGTSKARKALSSGPESAIGSVAGA